MSRSKTHRTRSRHVRFEALEARRLLACSIDQIGPVAEITGTQKADQVIVTQGAAPGTFDVKVQCFGMPWEAFSGSFSKLRFHGKDGDDFLANNSTLTIEADAGAGNDKLFGGSGHDILLGGPGMDVIEGRNGFDFLSGDGDVDRIDGGDGNDTIYGGSGDDVIQGGDDQDVIWGGLGNDSLYGQNGMDTLFGEKGNDGLYGGANPDALTGGEGSDRFLMDQIAFDGVFDLNLEEDAWILFADGEGEVLPDKSGYGPGTWSAADVEAIDEALRTVHRVAGDARLLKQLDGSSVTITRYGSPYGGDASDAATTPAWNAAGNIWMNDGAFTQMLDHFVYHEIGHTFHSKSFEQLSEWQPITSPVKEGYVASLDGAHQYAASASFAEEYGKTNPHEDFATSFAALFVDAAGKVFLPGPGAWAIPKKIEWLYKNVVK